MLNPGGQIGGIGRNIPMNLVDTSIREGDFMRADTSFQRPDNTYGGNAGVPELQRNMSRQTAITGLGIMDDNKGTVAGT